MVTAGELKKGIAIELDEMIYQIIEFQHIKVGRGSAQVRLKLRDIQTGSITERSFQANYRFTPAFLDHRSVQYLYNDGSLYYFMDNESYEQMALTAEQLDDSTNYLKEGMNLNVVICKGEAVNVELPVAVVLKVTKTDPGFKGDTASGGSKPAVMETGFTVQVPLFVHIGDMIKIDTRSGEYLEKAS
jgi:elongation factor P